MRSYPTKPRVFISAYAWGSPFLKIPLRAGRPFPLKPRGICFFSPLEPRGSPFLKDEKMGKRIFLRGRLPYAHENKKGTKRLTLKRNANVASLPLLFLMRKARTHKAKGFRLARIYPSFGAESMFGHAGFQKGGSPLAF